MENQENSLSELKARLQKADITLDDEVTKAILPYYEAYKHLSGESIGVMFSGGTDTSFLAHFLQHVVGAKVHTITVDVGTSVPFIDDNLKAEARSLQLGIDNHFALERKAELSELCMQAIQAEAKLGKEGHLPASSLSRAVICDAAVKIAKEQGINHLFHGSNGSQNNPHRFYAGLETAKSNHDYPDLQEHTPNMRTDMQTQNFRDIQNRYLEQVGVALNNKLSQHGISQDVNIAGNEREEGTEGAISNPANRYDLAEELSDFPSTKEPLQLSLRYEKGRPVAYRIEADDWIETGHPVELLEALNKLGAQRRIGIIDHPEGRPNGTIAREIHFAPAMEILYRGHYHLRSYLVDRASGISSDLDALSAKWAHWVMEKNQYTHPLVGTMNRVFRAFDKELNGEVTMELRWKEIKNIRSQAAQKNSEANIDPSSGEDVVNHHEKLNQAFELPEYYKSLIAEGINPRIAEVKQYRQWNWSSKEVLLSNTLNRIQDFEGVLRGSRQR